MLIEKFENIAPIPEHDTFVCAFFVSNKLVASEKLVDEDAHYNLSLLVDNEESYPESSILYGLDKVFKKKLNCIGSTRFFERWNPIYDLSKNKNLLLDYTFDDGSKSDIVANFKLSPDLLDTTFEGLEHDVLFLKSAITRILSTNRKVLTIVGSVGWGLEDLEFFPKLEKKQWPKNYLFWDRGGKKDA